MRPDRNFRFNKSVKQLFSIVAFRYDEPTSIAYKQYKSGEEVAELVKKLLIDKDVELEAPLFRTVLAADVISIRRVYLKNEGEVKTDDEQGKIA